MLNNYLQAAALQYIAIRDRLSKTWSFLFLEFYFIISLLSIVTKEWKAKVSAFSDDIALDSWNRNKFDLYSNNTANKLQLLI